RGNPQSWMYEPGKSALKRMLRFADAYIGLSGDNSHRVDYAGRPINIPASRFLRPYSKRLRPLDGLRLRRIRRELEAAAERARVYHLWWHPHNFGVNLLENLSFLEAVLSYFDALRRNYGMESLTMAECAARFAESKEIHDAVSFSQIH